MKKKLLIHIKGTTTYDRIVNTKLASTTLSKQPDGVVHWTIPKEEQVKKVLLGAEGSIEHVYIGANLQSDESSQLLNLLKEFKDVLAWKYTDLKGIPKHIGLHKIVLEPYPYNLNGTA